MSEKLTQLPLFTQFFAMAPKKAQIDDIAKAQLLVSTLGAIRAISNPIGPWQTIKGAFAFLGNRKGQLTPTVNEQIYTAITGSCSANVTTTVKERILQRSKQVKAGIQATKGHKSFTAFGMQELAAFAHVQHIVMFDLTELKPLSVALNNAALQSSRQGYHVRRQTTMEMEDRAKEMLSNMVNPVDEGDQ
jgi:transcriptional/translational regulatory protein YebC/TACO1